MKKITTIGAALVAFAALAERTEERITEWTCDGERVSIPHTWNAIDGADGSSNVYQDADNSVAGRAYGRYTKTYRTELRVPIPGKRQFLKCGGAAVTAMVCVNGRIVGTHRGAMTAFTFEITKFLREHDNVLEIVVDNHFDELQPPIYADYSIQGGLYRPVWLIETDPVCIDPTYYGGPGVELWPDADTGKIRVKTHLNGATDVTYEYAINGKKVAEPKVENPRLWSPEMPNLYDFAVTVRKGTWSDTVHQKIGFRKVEFRDDGFYLNGKKRQLKGVNYHQEREGCGWALTEKDIAWDLSLIKELGADSMRGAHYPHSAYTYDLCDAMGMLAWIEIPASGRMLANRTYMERLKETVREMVAQHRNHPSLYVWSLFNELYSISDGIKMPEGTAEPLVKELQALVKSLDADHPTTCAAAYCNKVELNGVADVFCFNTYPGWYGADSHNITNEVNKFLAKAGGRSQTLGIGEYGGGASIYHHENPLTNRHNLHSKYYHPEETQTELHWIEYGCIKSHPRVWGSHIWAMFDFASDNRNEGDHKGINDKGLITHDHLTRKDAFYFYKANWNLTPQLHLCSKRMIEANAAKVEVMAFSNVGPVALYVNGKAIGTQNVDSVNTVLWKNVQLQAGENVIEVRAGNRRDACTWRWSPKREQNKVISK